MWFLCVTSFERMPRGCARRLDRLVGQALAAGERVVCLTPEPLDGVTWHAFGTAGEVRCYNIDASTMKTMLRADNGVVELVDGVIRAKRNCRDVRP